MGPGQALTRHVKRCEDGEGWSSTEEGRKIKNKGSWGMHNLRTRRFPHNVQA